MRFLVAMLVASFAITAYAAKPMSLDQCSATIEVWPHDLFCWCPGAEVCTAGNKNVMLYKREGSSFIDVPDGEVNTDIGMINVPMLVLDRHLYFMVNIAELSDKRQMTFYNSTNYGIPDAGGWLARICPAADHNHPTLEPLKCINAPDGVYHDKFGTEIPIVAGHIHQDEESGECEYSNDEKSSQVSCASSD